MGASCTKKVAMTTPPAPPVITSGAASPPSMERSVATPSVVPTTRGARYPDAETQARINQILANLEDAYFDYDKAILRPDTLKVLQSNSSELRAILDQYPDYKLTIEGHCDERGSAEYNVALGDKRAHAAMDYLVNVGISTSQLSVLSYGKERPICREQNEDCWQRNRRAASLGQFADNIFSSSLVALAATASTEPWAKMNSEERRLAAGLFGVKASTSGWPTID